MNRIVRSKYFTVLVHALAWSIVLFFPYFIADARYQYKIGPLPGLYFTLSGIVHMMIFYGNTVILYPKLLNRAYWWAYILLAVLLLIASFSIKFLILAHVFPDVSPDAKSHVLFPSLMVFIVSIFYSITVDKIRSEKLQKENEAMQLEMELKFLRSQISPHFLFNVLTNLVSLARKKSAHLETSLLMLSELMRYMLYDADKKITLAQEMNYIESYIALQKLRFGSDVNVISTLELPQNEGSRCIEPMLLIPFVENAFKHGTGYIDQRYIEVRLRVRERMLVFVVKNRYDSLADACKDENSGIGLANVRARLALLYPDRHALVIKSDNNLFSINLTIELI